LSSEALCSIAKQLVAPSGLQLLFGASSGDASEDKKRREEAKEEMEKINQEREAAGNYIKQLAKALKTLLDAGSNPDDALADELLGLSSAGQLAPLVKTSTAGYGTTEGARGDHEEEDGPETMDSSTMMATLASLMDSGIGKSSAANDGGGGGIGAMFGPASDLKKDKLNLSGLLNVLDGVVDTPERILIMTTNHPEQLDPALIRPGRIDKKILLGYMSPNHVIPMMEHYFQCELTSEQRGRLRVAILGSDEKGLPALNLTPAQIEQLCAEHDELEAMFAALEGKGGSGPAAVPKLESVPAATSADNPPPIILQRAASTTVAFDQ